MSGAASPGQQVWNGEQDKVAIDNDRAPQASVHLDMRAKSACAKPLVAQLHMKTPFDETQALSSTAAERLPQRSVNHTAMPKPPDDCCAVLVSVPHLCVDYEASGHLNVVGLY